MFTDQFVTEVARQVAEILKPHIEEILSRCNQNRWPEVMTLATAGQYMDRTDVAVRHLISKREIPRVALDSKPQVRRIDIDAMALRHLI